MIKLSGLSERFLVYDERGIRHRMILFHEAAGMLDSDFAAYLTRTLLSEGHLQYGTVEATGEGLKPRIVTREGPCGLITTTCEVSLHAENETRVVLSVPANDTRERRQR